MEINTMFVCHFADPDLGFEIFFKRYGAAEKGRLALILKYGIEAPLHTCIGVEENFMQSLSAFSFFFFFSFFFIFFFWCRKYFKTLE